ncbi:MAG TPA: FAD-dependent oxidoreductase [Solirubrobacteraceae bacterium]|nr:FAD-dependent oxidoreductase [Solirubrobacteraceae bacterium]
MRRDRLHIVIAGGGVAAVETLLALRELGGSRVEITLLSPEREFLYRPVTVAEAFDRDQAHSYALEDIVNYEGGGEMIWDRLESVTAGERVAVTASGTRVPFDALIVATGAIPTEPLPGALTFRGRGDVVALRGVLDDLLAGTARSIALTLPAERTWPLPIYELALMTAGTLQQHGCDAQVWLVTPEEEPLELFGPAGSRAIREMLKARHVRLQTSSCPSVVRGRALVLAGGGEIYVDRVVTLPELVGPRLRGLPHDQHGFIPIDSHGRVSGLQDIYAAGDVTTFPLKQGGLAAQQADAVAETILADLGIPVTPKPFTPVLRGLVMTDGAPLYLRAEPQHLTRETSVAIDATPRHSNAKNASFAAGRALWWPDAKIAGRYLAPFLASARPQPLTSALLTDRIAAPPPFSVADEDDASEFAFILADYDARWGDFNGAVDVLDGAEALQGTLPPEYETKRQQWRLAAAR